MRPAPEDKAINFDPGTIPILTIYSFEGFISLQL